MIFGKATYDKPLYLNGVPITAVSDYKYLGVHLVAGKQFATSARKPLQSFYCSAKTILNTLHRPSEHLLLKLLYCYCVPILTYACEVKRHTGRELTSLDVALNDCIRKIFTYNRWESTRELRRSFGYDSITETFTKRGSRFTDRLELTKNPILMQLKIAAQ